MTANIYMKLKEELYLKQNTLQNMIGFILKYIWIVCALLIVFEFISMSYTTSILMKQSALSVMQSVSGDISSRVDGVLRLLTGMATDERFADTSKPLFDRVTQAMPYQESYKLYMIAMTDQDVNVISADEKEPPSTKFSLAHRDYMQRLYSTGEYQITDAFLSGDGKDTLNYTIAVPIKTDGVVEGSVFGSIYFDDIESILGRQSQNQGRDFYLLGMDNTVMAGDDRTLNSKSFLELTQDSHIIQNDIETIDRSIRNGESGGYWELNKKGLTYVTYQRVTPTNWTIIYRVQFLAFFAELIPILCVKILFYILMCVAIFIFSRNYLNRHLSQLNHLLNRMATMQKEIFQSEYPDYDNFLELTQKGLTDQLTGLSTRAILFQKMLQLSQLPNYFGAVVFIDLDDLKPINDDFGHEGGDCALTYFAKTLKEYEQRYNGIVARYGGDEFVLILCAQEEVEASKIAHKLCKDLNASVSTEKHTFTIHGSLGVSFYPRHGTSLEDLICKADLALYVAKQEGKNKCAFFEEDKTML